MGKKRKYSLFLVCFIASYQLFETYNDYNKKYLFDTKEYLGLLEKDDQTIIMIQNNEFNRIKNSSGRYEGINKYIGFEKDFNLFENYYCIRGGKVCVASYDKGRENQNLTPYSKVIFRSKAGNKTKNYFNIISFNTLDSDAFFPKNEKNQLINGNLEEIENQETSKKKLTKWIDADCTFYKNDLLILPKHKNLLSYWEAPSRDNYPYVYLSSEQPIGGLYSLVVELHDRNNLYLLNVIEQKSGWLSFKIQSLDGKSHLIINEYTYSSDSKYITTYHLKDLILLDDRIHQISIKVPERNINDKKSLFVISGSNTTFKLDDLSYYFEQKD